MSTLFDKKGLPGQMNLFPDKAVPDCLVQRVRADDRDFGRLVEHGRKMARTRGETWCVAEIDSDCMERRVLHAMPLEATEYDEFVAWDGRILVIIETDGTVDNR